MEQTRQAGSKGPAQSINPGDPSSDPDLPGHRPACLPWGSWPFSQARPPLLPPVPTHLITSQWEPRIKTHRPTFLSQLHQSLTVGLWASFFPSLSLSFLIYKMSIIRGPKERGESEMGLEASRQEDPGKGSCIHPGAPLPKGPHQRRQLASQTSSHGSLGKLQHQAFPSFFFFFFLQFLIFPSSKGLVRYLKS